MAKTLKKYYEEPEELVVAEADYLEERLVYGDDEGEEEMWFNPQELSPESTPDEESETDQIQFTLIVDDEAPWPDDIETEPDHEVRIERSEWNCWYQIKTAECDAAYTETPDGEGCVREPVQISPQFSGAYLPKSGAIRSIRNESQNHAASRI